MNKFGLILIAGMVAAAVCAEESKPPAAAPQEVKKEHKVPAEVQKRRAEIQALCRQYRNLPESKRPEAKDQIMALLKQDYEAVQADRLKRIENLEKQLAKLKGDQNKNEDEVVNAEFERLTRPLPKKNPVDKPQP
ncbi:MAG: hypothetical protein AB7F32_00250 [Victivallaceae bacterium]